MMSDPEFLTAPLLRLFLGERGGEGRKKCIRRLVENSITERRKERKKKGGGRRMTTTSSVSSYLLLSSN